MWQVGTKKRGTVSPPFHDYCSIYLYDDVVELLEDCRATTIAATAAAAIATVVDTAAAAPAAAPEAAADEPAAPALPDADADPPADEPELDWAKDGNDKDNTKIIVVNIFKIRIKLTPTFS